MAPNKRGAECAMMRVRMGVCVVVVLALLSCTTFATRPVLIIHGLMDKVSDFDLLAQNIHKQHPGLTIQVPDLWSEVLSLEYLEGQMPAWINATRHFMSLPESAEGITLVCFSQGNMVCRRMLQTMPDHNVHTYIAMAGPHMGQFGDTMYLDWLGNVSRNEVYKIFYTKRSQETLSVPNYWNDPYQQELFKEFNLWLTDLNMVVNPNATYRANFGRLKQLVLLGGPDDGVITPWQSSHFGFFDANLTILPWTQQPIYKSLGLDTMNADGRIAMFAIPGVRHTHWRSNATVFNVAIGPYIT